MRGCNHDDEGSGSTQEEVHVRMTRGSVEEGKECVSRRDAGRDTQKRVRDAA